MLVRTFKILATDQDPVRIRARDNTGRETTVPYDYGSPTPHKDAATALTGLPVVESGWHTRGYVFRTVDSQD